MANTAPSRFLRNLDNSADDRALALKVFSGQVYESFTNKTVFFDNTGNIMATKVLTGGHEAQWPIMGTDPTPSYHTPGNEMLDGTIKMTEGIVRVDDILVSHIDVPFNDLNIAHFDVLAPFATKLGRSLAIDLDKKLAIVGIRAAQTAAVSGIHNGGKGVFRDDGAGATSATLSGATPASITAAYTNDSTGSGKFRDDCAELAQKFDEDNVPEDGRYLFIPPHIRTILRHEATTVMGGASSAAGPAGNIYSKDVTSVPGDLNRRIIGVLEGFNLIVTNHLPAASVTAINNAGNPNTKYDYSPHGLDATGGANAIKDAGDPGYDADAAAENAVPAALALCGASEGAASMGMVQAAGIRSVIQDDERRNTKFMKSQIMVGADVLCPWTAGIIGVIT
jgi:hypothetical protein